MPTPLSLSSRRRDDGAAVLTAVGEIDLSNIDAFDAALRAAVDGGGTVTVDLARVEYLDSGAINVLFGHTDHIQLVVNPILLSVCKVSGLADVVNIRPAPDR